MSRRPPSAAPASVSTSPPPPPSPKDDGNDDGNDDDDNVASLRSLENLSSTLATLDDSGVVGRRRRRHSRDGGDERPDSRSNLGGLPLSHWRILPSDVQQAYEMFEEGSKLIKATSTKYALVGKIDKKEGSKLSVDLRKGCELVASAAIVLHDPSVGCSRSARSHAKKFARSVLSTVVSLIRCFVDGTALEGNVGAQHTGAVWDATDRYATLPKGNRNSMRRDLMVWASEVAETTEEFGGYLELGPAKEEEEGKSGGENEEEEEDRWDDFCGGDTERYVAREFPIVEACVGLAKCTRGSLNVTTKALEAVGKSLPSEEEEGGDDDDDVSKERRRRRARTLQWMSDLHELARASGEGVTDLGACLYPPLKLEDEDDSGDRDGDTQREGSSSSPPSSELERQIVQQRDAVLSVARFVLDADATLELPEELTKAASRIAANATARGEEATEALRAATSSAKAASSTTGRKRPE